MDVIKKLIADREKDASEWKVTAHDYETRGYYDWMADCLGVRNSLVLEVGVGSGASTLAICRRNNRVVGLDENPANLDIAESRLKEHKVSAARLRRDQPFRAKDEGSYEQGYESVMEAAEQSVLIDGDVLFDPDLTVWLQSAGTFGAVTCWLMGTHSSKHRDELVRSRGISTMGAYRNQVQDAVYGLSAKVLASRGVLQIVDRVNGTPCAESLAKLTQQYTAAASAHHLTLVDTAWKEVEDFEVNGGKRMESLDVPVRRVTAVNAFVSVKFLAP